MNSLFRFLIYSNTIVAFGVFSLYKITEIVFSFHNTTMGFFMFFSTLFAYNYMRIVNFSTSKQSNILLEFNSNKITYYILFISGLISIYLILLLGRFFLTLLSPVILISILYPLIIRINNKTYGIRGIPLFKVFLIALVWTYVTLLLPLLYNSNSLNYLFLDFFFQRFLFVIAISIPFDIRDVNTDKIETLPNKFGIYQSKVFSWFCLFTIDLLLVIDVISQSISIPLFIALFLSIELASIVIYLTNHNRSYLFYGIVVEGLSIIMCLFVLFASSF